MPYKDPVKKREYHLRKSREWDVAHPGDLAKRQAKHRSKPNRAESTRYLMRRYGLTLEDYERMLASQGGGCALCGVAPKVRRLHVDHDHQTKKIRSLLCYRCNKLMVGCHTLETARRTVAYLERHAA